MLKKPDKYHEKKLCFTHTTSVNAPKTELKVLFCTHKLKGDFTEFSNHFHLLVESIIFTDDFLKSAPGQEDKKQLMKTMDKNISYFLDDIEILSRYGSAITDLLPVAIHKDYYDTTSRISKDMRKLQEWFWGAMQSLEKFSIRNIKHRNTCLKSLKGILANANREKIHLRGEIKNLESVSNCSVGREAEISHLTECLADQLNIIAVTRKNIKHLESFDGKRAPSQNNQMAGAAKGFIYRLIEIYEKYTGKKATVNNSHHKEKGFSSKFFNFLIDSENLILKAFCGVGLLWINDGSPNKERLSSFFPIGQTKAAYILTKKAIYFIENTAQDIRIEDSKHLIVNDFDKLKKCSEKINFDEKYGDCFLLPSAHVFKMVLLATGSSWPENNKALGDMARKVCRERKKVK